ncbi:hypothetical protein ETB97_007332 [Aspergillus alliaceus]|uniref:Uncharacterized protein n=1 Tax=Petromyces alliaceus TaxID=209559 RepID=A0A8H6E317_PETAA|nr:hypothetical protein ETB97_007332 [Aspergillus burnettii]
MNLSLGARLWEGNIPLSEQRWREKELNHPANFELACQYLSSVVATFEYLNKPHVAKNFRDTFNLIYDHWEGFDAIANQKRDEQGLETVSVARRWTEYIAAHYEAMTERAHHWVISHVFLVVDDASVASYMSNSYSAATKFVPHGDFAGFVLAIDANYDPEEGTERPDESPGYYGQMRILGNLICVDLYAMLLS